MGYLTNVTGRISQKFIHHWCAFQKLRHVFFSPPARTAKLFTKFFTVKKQLCSRPWSSGCRWVKYCGYFNETGKLKAVVWGRYCGPHDQPSETGDSGQSWFTGKQAAFIYTAAFSGTFYWPREAESKSVSGTLQWWVLELFSNSVIGLTLTFTFSYWRFCSSRYLRLCAT